MPSDLTTLPTISDATIVITDVTTGNVSITAHGFAPKLPNDATKYLNGVGAWATVSGNPFSDAAALVSNAGDPTKLAILSAASITTGTTRTYTLPDESAGLATTSGSTAMGTLGAQQIQNGLILGQANAITGFVQMYLSGSLRRLTIDIGAAAAANRTLHLDWSALTADRNLKFGNGTMDLGLTINGSTGTGPVVNQSSPQIGYAINATPKTANYTTLATDSTILVNPSGGAFTITLSSANAIAGQIYVFKCTATSANAVTFSPSSGNIDNAASKTMTPVTTLESATIQFDGTNWWIISSNVTAL